MSLESSIGSRRLSGEARSFSINRARRERGLPLVERAFTHETQQVVEGEWVVRFSRQG
jgi:hypothetical protein